MRNLVVTADDGFYGEQRDVGIVRCLKEFGVTEVSVIVNSTLAISLLPLSNADRSERSRLFAFLLAENHIPGLHFNLTEGIPLCTACTVATLLDEQDHFLGKYGLRKKLLSSSNGNSVRQDHIERELERQLSSFHHLFLGPPSHVDGHQHVHVLPAIVPVLCRVLPRHGVRWIRLPQESGANLKFASTYLTKESLDFYRTISSQAAVAKLEFIASGLRCTDAFVGMTLMGRNQTLTKVSQSLQRVGDDGATTVEFMTHPGFRLKPNQASDVGCGEGPDEFSCSADREFEMEFLLGQPFHSFLEQSGYRRVRFADLLP
ncbi:YdjC chitooligosaccharide deacetylase [Paragonimus heterotremus]|uniref:Carbohydrate deacetylase n=1 Tax=Paragonimus heterotremus TaxID=100268 RepID=A0A8J4TCQ5_9TREM|nr:YdjC chitooligosaccharide deacetylase [Paragonimus heterotremus]